MKAVIRERIRSLRAQRGALETEFAARIAPIDAKLKAAEDFLASLADEAEREGYVPDLILNRGTPINGSSNGAESEATKDREYGANMKAVRSLLPHVRLQTFNVRDIVAGLMDSDTPLNEYQAGQVLRKLVGKEIEITQEGAGRRPTEYKKLSPTMDDPMFS